MQTKIQVQPTPVLVSGLVLDVEIGMVIGLVAAAGEWLAGTMPRVPARGQRRPAAGRGEPLPVVYCGA